MAITKLIISALAVAATAAGELFILLSIHSSQSGTNRF